MNVIALLEPLRDTPFDLLSALRGALLAFAGVAVLRALDVTFGVFKTTFTVMGRRGLATLCAGLESATWLLAAGITLGDLSAPRFLGFAGGVAGGTWVGMVLVHHLRLGLVTLRAFVPVGEGREAAGLFLAEHIRALGHGATTFRGEGRDGPVDMVLSVVRRREARELVELLGACDSKAFLAVDSTPAPGSVVGGMVGATV